MNGTFFKLNLVLQRFTIYTINMYLPKLNMEEIKDNSFFQFVSKCYLHIIFIVMFILFLVEFFYLFNKNPEDLMKSDFFVKYLNMSSKLIKQK